MTPEDIETQNFLRRQRRPFSMDEYLAFLKSSRKIFGRTHPESPPQKKLTKPQIPWADSILVNSHKVVIPAQAGIQPRPKQLKTLDSRFRGNDPIRLQATFREAFNFVNWTRVGDPG